MKPRPLNLAAAVSLLLAVAIVGLWVRSYARREAIARIWHTSTERHVWEVQSRYSSLAFHVVHYPDSDHPFASHYEYDDFTAVDSMDARLRDWFPFPPARYVHLSGPPYPYDRKELALAYWLLLPPTLVLPGIAVVRHRRRRRRERGNLCPTCGYDRRAHSPTARCPECGTVPTGGV